MPTHHAVVWIDHQQAHVMHFDADHVESKNLKSHAPHRSSHSKHDSSGSSHSAPDTAFFASVATELKGSLEILVTGPAATKHEFVKYLKSHQTEVARRIAGIENLDHPSDGQVVAFARKFFVGADRMRGNTPGQFAKE